MKYEQYFYILYLIENMMLAHLESTLQYFQKTNQIPEVIPACPIFLQIFPLRCDPPMVTDPFPLPPIMSYNSGQAGDAQSASGVSLWAWELAGSVCGLD